MSEWKNGLPPVGEVCEILWNGVWVKAIIKFLGSNVVVFDLNGEEESSYYTTDNHCRPFRPLKSEADRRRDEFKRDVLNHWNELGEDCPIYEPLLVDHLIKKGYRKVNALTDEQIALSTPKIFHPFTLNAQAFIDGAQWARSQILREES